MAFPHVFQRSGRRGGREPHQAPSSQAATARQISAQLGNLLDKAEGSDMQTLAYLIECARIEAERLASGPV